MTVIKLQSLAIHNFKGIHDFVLEPKGENTSILGMNATGKTTIFDAFTWLLFGKNSEEAKQFNVKPLNAQGEEILGLEPEVTATLRIGNKNTVLKRVLTEVWTKPAGQLEKVRKPDKTVLYIDDVPQKVKEYEEYINGLINMDAFKIITNPAAFTSTKWEQQRSMLMSLIKEINDQDILAANPKLSSLSELLTDSTVEAQRKRISSQKSQIKKDIDALPARIDEATRAIPETVSTSTEALQSMKQTYVDQITSYQQEISMLKDDKSGIEQQQKIADLNLQLSKRESEFLAGRNLQLSGLRNDLNTTEDKYREIQRSAQDTNVKSEQLTLKIVNFNQKNTELAAEWLKVNGQTFDEHAEKCPTCGQELPGDKVAELKADFNKRKSEKLEAIAKQGEEVSKAKITELENQLNELKEQLDQLASDGAIVLEKLNQLKTEYATQEEQAGNFQSTEEYQKITAEIADLRAQPDATQANYPKVDELETKIAEARQDIAKIDSALVDKQAAQAQKQRISELEVQDQTLKEKFAELEKQAYLIDQFTRAKVTVIEDRINSKFEKVKFKLFENQKNGELKETCEATVNGVPFSDLNNAARINAGLDIINTLTDYYQTNVPIFVDNAESVNELIETKSQQIRLVVSEDEKLKVVA